MARQTSTNRVKATVWTKTMRMDLDRNIEGAMEMLMFGLDAKERREIVLASLKQIHEKMTWREAETKGE